MHRLWNLINEQGDLEKWDLEQPERGGGEHEGIPHARTILGLDAISDAFPNAPFNPSTSAA
jgi:hypothetical protein